MNPDLPIQHDAQKVEAVTSHPRGGLALCFDPAADVAQHSDRWSIAGWTMGFYYLPPTAEMKLPVAENYIKVIVGSLKEPERECFADDFTVRTTRVEHASVQAGDQGALLMHLVRTREASLPLRHMEDCRFSGSASSALVWKRFSERFGAFTAYFDALDNHMADGFHLINPAGEEIVYVNFWTCGKGGDVSTHNHGQPPSARAPAFVEVHLVLSNGTGEGGMYEADAAADGPRVRHVMQAGDEHGPFFHHRLGKPVRLANGAVSYPWHGWNSGDNDDLEQSYDLVAAFEINPDFAQLAVATESVNE